MFAGDDLEGAGRARARAASAAALHRPALRRQRAQPHRSPVRACSRRRRQERRPDACACTCCSTGATCPRPSALQYVDALEQLLAGSARRARLPHRLGRRAHGHHHGPLRGRLAHGRARLERARARQGAAVPERAREAIETLRAEQSGHRRSGPAAVRDRRRTGSRSGRSRTATSVVLFNFRGDRAIEITPRVRGARRSTSSIASACPTCCTPA